MENKKYLRTKPYPPKFSGASLIGQEELDELRDVIAEKSPFRHYGLGTPGKVNLFEEEAAKYLGSKYTLALSSGTAAISCALAAMGIGNGDEVILPAFGWFSDYMCIVNSGALPVFADIDDTLNLDPADFEKKITPNTKAVIVIHYQGGAAEMDTIMDIARANNIKVIEDVAQAFGGEYKGRKLGTIGDIAMTSFQANKILTCGEGGLLYTDNEKYFAKAVRYHDLGSVRDVFAKRISDKELLDSSHEISGGQFRMSELSGAFLRAQLGKLDMILSSCRSCHKEIKKAFKYNKGFEFRPVDEEGDCGITAYIKMDCQETVTRMLDYLKGKDVPIGATSACTNILETSRVQNKGLACVNNPPFGPGFNGDNIVYDEAQCPNTNKILSRHISVPIGPLYTAEDVQDIVLALTEAYEYAKSK